MKRTYAAILLLMAISVGAFANDAKISPDLRRLSPSDKKRVIVQYKTAPASCGGLLGTVTCLVDGVLKLGGQLLGDLPLVNGVVALLDGNSIVNLSNDPNVAYISADRPVTLMSSD